MLTIRGGQQRVCQRVSRRDVLRAAGTGLFGVSLSKVLAAEETARPFQGGRAKSVLFLFLFGGPSQLETFDLKPTAPSTLRGPFKPIASRTPGLLISEHLSRCAKISDKFAVIRSMTHPYNDHGAAHYIQTGHPHPNRFGDNPDEAPVSDREWPAMGSVIEYLSQHASEHVQRPIPDYVYFPNRLGPLQGGDRPGQYAGWLGKSYNALATDIRKRGEGDNPYFRDCDDSELDFRFRGLPTKTQMPLDRLDRRHSLLEQFDQQRKLLDESQAIESYNKLRGRAFTLVSSEKIRRALDIRQESAALRDRYGRHLFGQSTLMGRRMIEAGTRFVTVTWDSHGNSRDLRDHLLPGFDQAFSALMTDLEDRGLLEETLVVVVGEMGRTPRANDSWGRGHWSHCFPALLAGAGIRGGIVYGRSDQDAAYPSEHPTSPADLAATIS